MRSFAINPFQALAGTDPGRARLIKASSVSAAVLASTCTAWLIIRLTHSDAGFLAAGAVIALMTGMSVKDATGRDRVITTAFLTLPAAAGVSVAVLLSHYRLVEIGVFVLVAGGATWLRKFGSRWSAIGMLGFFSYFFGLILKPTVDQLPVVIAIAVIAVLAALLSMALTLRTSPTRTLNLLIRQFAGACATALAAASQPAPDRRQLLKCLDRTGDVAGAIADWQTQNDTAAQIGVGAEELQRLVFDARTDLVQACLAVARTSSTVDRSSTDPLVEALAKTLTAWPAPDATQVAQEQLDEGTAAGVLPALLARAVQSQSALREAMNGDPGSAVPAEPEPSPAPPAPDDVAPESSSRRSWRDWAPTSRMAVQVMPAAALAAVAGDAISASRWYWAVLTAFLIFVGTTTRAAILTRAYRRILGTVAGTVVGVALMLLADHSQGALIAISVIAVFCMVYFGPLTYTARSFFVTVMLAALFGLLGVLNRQLLEWRIEETVTGAVIGVLCAFLIVSTSSRPDLVGRLQSYFDSLDDALAAGGSALTGSAGSGPVLATIHRLDADHTELQTFSDAMRVSFPLSSQRDLRRPTTDLLQAATIHADRFAQEAITIADAPHRARLAAGSTETVVRQIRDQAEETARALLHRTPGARDTAAHAVDAIDRAGAHPHTPEFRAMIALAEISAVLAHLARLRDDR